MEERFDSDTLRQGEMLNWYRIEGILGRGGFGVTYLALDTNLDLQVAIKEYLPEQIARRDADNSVQPVTEQDHETFRWGLERFITEARTLVKFKHQNIVRVMSVFESNDTAYMVMEFERGQDLKQLLEFSAKNGQKSSESFLKSVVTPITHGLEEVHHHGFIHRDIKPANIYIRENKTPVLLDFGSARQALSSQTRQLTAMVSAGYAPLEQYNDSNQAQQGPWTDIYALGAVLYYAISGAPPLDSTLRASAILNDKPDPLKPAAQFAGDEYSPAFLSAIDWALGFKVADRPQTLDSWRDALLGVDASVAVPVSRSIGRVSSLDELDNFEMPPSGVASGSDTSNDVWGSANGRRGPRARKRRPDIPFWRSKKVIGASLVAAGFAVYQFQFKGESDSPVVALDSPSSTDQSVETASVDILQESDKVTDSVSSAQTDSQNEAVAVAPNSEQSSAEIASTSNLPAIELQEPPSVIEPGVEASNEVTQPPAAILNSEVEPEIPESVAPLTPAVKPNPIPQTKPKEKPVKRTAEPISQADIQEVTRNFNNLRIAIETKNLQLIEELVNPSSSKINFFEYAFSNFEQIDVSLASISTQRSTQTIRARLEIEKMVRDNGDRAMLADTFRSIVLSSERIDGVWSKISW